MVMALGAPPGMKMGQTFTADCPLPTADYFHDKCAWRWVFTTPGDENAVAVSGRGGRIAETPDDETVVAGSGVPGLYAQEAKSIIMAQPQATGNRRICCRNPLFSGFLSSEKPGGPEQQHQNQNHESKNMLVSG